jgi:ABC-type phosphate transport system substrate-binding protein
MGLLSKKRAAVLAALGTGALAVALPGAASASTFTPITGQGASFQGAAHNDLWIPGAPAGAGFGNITYTPNSSGTGLTAWRFRTPGGTPSGDEFIGTDDAPTAAEIANAKAAAGNSSVHVIPIAQGSVALLVNLPASCSISAPAVADAQDVQDAYRTSVTFANLFPSATGAGCSATVRAYARSSASGTTRAWKTYLSGINAGAWNGSGGNTLADTAWPGTSVFTRSAGGTALSSGSVLASAVASDDGTIGYAVLADAVAAGFSGTTTTGTFFANLRNGSVAGSASPLVTSSGVRRSNCASTDYGTFPSTTEDADWSSVYAVNPGTSRTYPVCALTYALAYDAPYEGAPSVTGRTFTAAQGLTARNYLSWVTDDASGAGQEVVDRGNYSRLPATIQAVAEPGANDISNTP